MRPLELVLLPGGVALGAVGVWMMLPGAPAGRRAPGILLAVAGAALVAAGLPGLGDPLTSALFFVLCGVTLLGAAGTLAFRSPVYAALSFGLSLLGTAGLLFLQGTQFLGVATVVVYAGAILVTFLFVLMLAEPRGRATYDRVGFGPGMAVLCGALLVATLIPTLASMGRKPEGLLRPPPPADARRQGVLASQHVKQLGNELFGRHLVAIQGAGVLLLAALVGAAVLVGQGRTRLPAPRAGQPAQSPGPNQPRPSQGTDIHG